MASPQISSRRKSRRLLILMSILAVIIIAYTAGWFYLASQAKARASTELDKVRTSGISVQCRNLTAQGYPFALYINCNDIAWQDTQQAVNMSSKALSIGASLFSPMTVQNTMTGPAVISLQGATSLKADWDMLNSSANLNDKQMRDIRINTENLRLQQDKLPNASSTDTPASVTLAGLHFNLNSLDEPLKINMTFDDLRVQGLAPLDSLPEIDGMLDLSSPGSLNSLQSSDGASSVLRGKSLTINQALLLLPSGASLSVSGPFAVDDEGMSNGDLKIRLTNPAAIGKILQTVFPDQAKNIATVTFALGSMPKDETGATIVPLIIRNSKVSASFIPVGRIPRL